MHRACAGCAGCCCHRQVALQQLVCTLNSLACWVPHMLLQATVGEATLDAAAVVLRQQIVLTNVPIGTGHVVFSADDFGNFLVHPLMGDAVRSAVQVRRIINVWSHGSGSG